MFYFKNTNQQKKNSNCKYAVVCHYQFITALLTRNHKDLRKQEFVKMIHIQVVQGIHTYKSKEHQNYWKKLKSKRYIQYEQ